MSNSAWVAKDKFFEKGGYENIVEVFDFDYQAIIDFETKKANCGLLWCPPCWLSTPCHFMCTLPNIKDLAEAQHIAVTMDGILYVVDKHKQGSRCDFDMQGKVSKTVPFDKLTDCDIEEPAGEDCCVQRSLFTVNADTASGHELQLVGMHNPHGFKATVWQMKRGEHPKAITSALTAPGQASMGPTTFGTGNEELVGLLKKNNELLEQIERNTRKMP